MSKIDLFTLLMIITGISLIVNVLFFQEPLTLTFSQGISTYGLAIYCLVSGYWIKLLFEETEREIMLKAKENKVN